jgi:tetratricopeptide (TPR) repeat protein
MVGPMDAAQQMLQQLCADLRRLWAEADGPSVRALTSRVGLGKSQIGAILNGRIRQLPDWSVVHGLITSFLRYAQDHGRTGRLTLSSGVDEYWRPRYALVEYALANPAHNRAPGERATPARRRPPWSSPHQLTGSVRRFAGRELELAGLTGLMDQADQPAGTVVPAQLARDIPSFTGRTEHLERLDALLTHMGTAGLICVIAGSAGVGKTALAVHWAHRVRQEFPDGQLYINLHGIDPTTEPTTPADAIGRFLDALEVPPYRIPTDLDSRTGLYRSLLADKRLLIVLDNARDADQLRPLLPGAPGCLVLVTSRNRLTSLIATEDAQPIAIDLLTHDEAYQLLTARLGAARVVAEPDAVDSLIAACARLPLALAIVAAHATADPHTSLTELAKNLHTNRLATLTAGDAASDIRAVLSWSYRALTDPAARLLRLLALAPTPEISTTAAASLAGIDQDRTTVLLTELTNANLVTEPAPGRYTIHDLLRAYASEQSPAGNPDTDRNEAMLRLIDHYLHTAQAAALLLEPRREPPVTAQPHPGTCTEHLTSYQHAIAWSRTEEPALAAAIRYATDAGLDSHTWQLTWTTWCLYNQRSARHDWIAAHYTALAAARRSTDPRGQTYAHRGLGLANAQMGRHHDACAHLRRASHLCHEPPVRAEIHVDLARLYEGQGNFIQALHHAQQALELYRAAGTRYGEANTLNIVGWYHAHLGAYHQALAHCEQALHQLQQLGDLDGQAATWDSLGYTHHHLGNPRQATACYHHAINLFRDLGDHYYQAQILTHLGDAHHATGDDQTARGTWQQALAILDKIDHPEAEAIRAKLTPKP